ncbi:MAG TPA: tautomerase family protein [Xanthobacteraceae bacterium]|nr:tautomerase family protein [Xanthobacteraceae bacterium]
MLAAAFLVTIMGLTRHLDGAGRAGDGRVKSFKIDAIHQAQFTRRLMPSTRIMTGQWAQGHEMELIEAVQAALSTSIKIPEWDRDVVVELYDANRRIVPTGRSERFTRIEIKLFAGRSLEAKRSLYQSIVRNLAVLGIAKNEIKIILLEIAAQDWGLRGGLPGSEIDIGFKIDV